MYSRYMAPEMVQLLDRNAKSEGYDSKVDWWSLAVTAFVLLTGQKPFEKVKHPDLFVDDTYRLETDPAKTGFPEYDALTRPITYPPYLSNHAVDFIATMLVVDEHRRITSCDDPVSAIKAHPFFSAIDWDLLQNKRLRPPYIPPPLQEREPLFANFNEMMNNYNHGEWVRYKPAQDVQRYFQKW